MAKSQVNIEDTFKPKSYEIFKPNWLCWKIMGLSVNTDAGRRTGLIFYTIILNILITICYPLHLGLYLFQSDSQADNIKNFAICIACAACSLKFIVYATKMPVVRQFQMILQKLDDRIIDGLELDYFLKLKRRLRTIALVFSTVYFPISIMAEISFWFREDRSLLYPGWFPFNWLESTWKFHLAHFYQIVGLLLLTVQNYANDCFPSMALCILSGHIKLLSMRVARIGHDDALSMEDNEKELNRCIIDLNTLYELCTTIQHFISLSMFIQFCVTAVNICVAMAALLFFVSAPMDFVYYVVYFLAMPLEIFPTCYFASDFQYQFDQLHRAIFASNWTNQSVKFKKHMMLFTERSLKSTVVLAGGMIRVHLDTFFATCRAAYSLFAIIVQMK